MTSSLRKVIPCTVVFVLGCGAMDDQPLTTIGGGKAEEKRPAQQFASWVGTYKLPASQTQDVHQLGTCPHTVTLAVDDGVLTLTTVAGTAGAGYRRTSALGDSTICTDNDTYAERYVPGVDAQCNANEYESGGVTVSVKGQDTLLQNVIDATENNGTVTVFSEVLTQFRFEGNTVTMSFEIVNDDPSLACPSVTLVQEPELPAVG